MTLANSTARAFTGTHSLGFTLLDAAGTPALDTQTGPFTGLGGGSTITYHVWSPTGGTWSVNAFVFDGAWAGHYGSAQTLAAGWNTISFLVPNTVTSFNAVGLQINNSGHGGTLYLDSVGWSGAPVHAAAHLPFPLTPALLLLTVLALVARPLGLLIGTRRSRGMGVRR